VDILLADVLDHVALFSEGGLKIVEPEAVRAYFEVKSTFSRSKLREALKHIREVQNTFGDEHARGKVWRCAFFNSAGKGRLPSKVIFEETRNVVEGLGTRDTYLPNCIVVNGSSATFITPTDNAILLRYFETKNYSLACALADVITAVRDEEKGLPNTDLQRIVELLDVPAPTKYSI
jgi:hypothetical protein